jgi:hypothetical protein
MLSLPVSPSHGVLIDEHRAADDLLDPPLDRIGEIGRPTFRHDELDTWPGVNLALSSRQNL